MKYTLGLKGLPFEPHPKQIIYVENEYNVEVNNFITSHYKWICEHFADRGYDFCYLPNITDKFNEFVCDYYVLDNSWIPKNIFDSDFILRYMAHPQNRQNIPPSLLYYSEWATIRYGEEVALRGITIDDIKQHDFDLADILLEIEEDQRGPIPEIRFSYAEKRPDEIDGNEKVDIIKYSDSLPEYVAAALSPASVISVEMEDERSCRVTVSPDQLSLAIGKEGQNAKLVARLTGCKIDIKA
jgi:hypothetical protein